MAYEGPRASWKWGDSVGDSYTNTPKMVSKAGRQEARVGAPSTAMDPVNGPRRGRERPGNLSKRSGLGAGRVRWPEEGAHPGRRPQPSQHRGAAGTMSRRFSPTQGGSERRRAGHQLGEGAGPGWALVPGCGAWLRWLAGELWWLQGKVASGGFPEVESVRSTVWARAGGGTARGGAGGKLGGARRGEALTMSHVMV